MVVLAGIKVSLEEAWSFFGSYAIRGNVLHLIWPRKEPPVTVAIAIVGGWVSRYLTNTTSINFTQHI